MYVYWLACPGLCFFSCLQATSSNMNNAVGFVLFFNPGYVSSTQGKGLRETTLDLKGVCIFF